MLALPNYENLFNKAEKEHKPCTEQNNFTWKPMREKPIETYLESFNVYKIQLK